MEQITLRLDKGFFSREMVEALDALGVSFYLKVPNFPWVRARLGEARRSKKDPALWSRSGTLYGARLLSVEHRKKVEEPEALECWEVTKRAHVLTNVDGLSEAEAGRKARRTGPGSGRGGGGAVEHTPKSSDAAAGPSHRSATSAHRSEYGGPAEHSTGAKTTGLSLMCRIRVDCDSIGHIGEKRSMERREFIRTGVTAVTRVAASTAGPIAASGGALSDAGSGAEAFNLLLAPPFGMFEHDAVLAL